MNISRWQLLGISPIGLRGILSRDRLPNFSAPFLVERAGYRQYEVVHLVAPVNVIDQPLNCTYVSSLALVVLLHRELFLMYYHFRRTDPGVAKMILEWSLT